MAEQLKKVKDLCDIIIVDFLPVPGEKTGLLKTIANLALNLAPKDILEIELGKNLSLLVTQYQQLGLKNIVTTFIKTADSKLEGFDLEKIISSFQNKESGSLEKQVLIEGSTK